MQSKHMYTLARALMALIFLIAGARKAMAFAGTVGYFGSLGVPAPQIVLPLVILLEIGGAIALIIGWQTRLVALAMGVFTLAAGFFGHAFWAAEPAQFAGQLNNFLKNVAMAGGFLGFIYIENERLAGRQP